MLVLGLTGQLLLATQDRWRAGVGDGLNAEDCQARDERGGDGSPKPA
jgi:hypothetical protein